MSVTKSPPKRFFDQSYLGREKDLDLFIQSNRAFLYLAYFDAREKKMVGVEERYLGDHSNWHQFSQRLAEVFQEEALKKEYRTVSFTLIDKTYTLIPSALYDEKSLSTYLKLNHGEEAIEHATILSEEIPDLKMRVVYAFPPLLKKFLEERFKKVKLHHHSVPLLEAFVLQEKKGEELQLHIQHDHFDLLYYKDHSLQLLNTFDYQTVEDFIYYLLYVMEQLKIDRNRLELKLYGEFEQRSTLYDTLYKYVRHPNIQNRNSAITYSQPLNQLPLQHYYNLFNQYLCG